MMYAILMWTEKASVKPPVDNCSEKVVSMQTRGVPLLSNLSQVSITGGLSCCVYDIDKPRLAHCHDETSLLPLRRTTPMLGTKIRMSYIYHNVVRAGGASCLIHLLYPPSLRLLQHQNHSGTCGEQGTLKLHALCGPLSGDVTDIIWDNDFQIPLRSIVQCTPAKYRMGLAQSPPLQRRKPES